MEQEINTGLIMDQIAKGNIATTKEDKEKSVLDNQKMMQAFADYKNAHTPKIKEHNIGRNDLCPCGSGKKYKNCCLESGKYENYKLLTKR